jgi:cell division protein FtsB
MTELEEAKKRLEATIRRLTESVEQNGKTKAQRVVEFAQKHALAILAITTVVVFVLVIFGPALLLGIRHGFSNRQIEETKTEATAEKTAADEEKISAGEIEIERKAEDLNRERSLKPKREQSAAALAEASRRRRDAEELYEKNRKAGRSPAPDDLNLHRRNCSDLAELYPTRRFAGCH